MSINPCNLKNNNMPSYCYKQKGKNKNKKMLLGEISPLKNEQFRALARICSMSTSQWSIYNGLLNLKFLTLSSWESSSSPGFGFTGYIQSREFSVFSNLYSEKLTLCEDIERANKPQLLAASPKISELWANTKKEAHGDIFTFKDLCKGHATTPNSQLLLKKIIIICIHYMSYIFQKRKTWVYYMNNRSRPQNMKLLVLKLPLGNQAPTKWRH